MNSNLLKDYQRRYNNSVVDTSVHLPILFFSALGGKTVIELGVCEGNSTCAFLAAGADLWSADIAVPATPPEWGNLPNWHFMQSDDLADECKAWLPAETDVLYIDSYHTCDHATAELKAYAPRVKAGGVILLHDTQYQDGVGDLGEPTGEIAWAIGDFCTGHGLRWYNHPGFYGLGIIPITERIV